MDPLVQAFIKQYPKPPARVKQAGLLSKVLRLGGRRKPNILFDPPENLGNTWEEVGKALRAQRVREAAGAQRMAQTANAEVIQDTERALRLINNNNRLPLRPLGGTTLGSGIGGGYL